MTGYCRHFRSAENAEVRGALAFLVLVLAFAVGSILGWWAVPATAALWGALRPSVTRPALQAALAAALAWAGWLVADGIAGKGVFGVLAARLSSLMSIPSFGLVVLTLVFAAILAWSSAAFAGAVAGRLRR